MAFLKELSSEKRTITSPQLVFENNVTVELKFGLFLNIFNRIKC